MTFCQHRFDIHHIPSTIWRCRRLRNSPPKCIYLLYFDLIYSYIVKRFEKGEVDDTNESISGKRKVEFTLCLFSLGLCSFQNLILFLFEVQNNDKSLTYTFFPFSNYAKHKSSINYCLNIPHICLHVQKY